MKGINKQWFIKKLLHRQKFNEEISQNNDA